MNLRRKMLLALSVIAFVGITGMWIFTDWTLSAGFEEMEVATMEATVMWGVEDLNDLALIMDSAAGPIAAWDDMYDYVISQDPAFIDEVFGNNVLERNKFNLALIYSNTGELIYGKYYDYLTNTEKAIPQTFTEYTTFQKLQNYSPDTGSAIGLIENQGEIIIFQ